MNEINDLYILIRIRIFGVKKEKKANKGVLSAYQPLASQF